MRQNNTMITQANKGKTFVIVYKVQQSTQIPYTKNINPFQETLLKNTKNRSHKP